MVLGAADLPAQTFTPHLLNDVHAPMVTVILEEQALAGLFDQARLAALPEALADCQKLGDPTVVARTLLAQINYTADVAANMPPHTSPRAVISSDLPGERDKTPQPSSFGCVRFTCTCRSRLHPACAAHLRTQSPFPGLSPSLRLHHVRCTMFTLAGSSRIRLPLQALSLSGTWLDSATGRV